jgi:hypothetical protein
VRNISGAEVVGGDLTDLNSNSTAASWGEQQHKKEP